MVGNSPSMEVWPGILQAGTAFQVPEPPTRAGNEVRTKLRHGKMSEG